MYSLSLQCLWNPQIILKYVNACLSKDYNSKVCIAKVELISKPAPCRKTKPKIHTLLEVKCESKSTLP